MSRWIACLWSVNVSVRFIYHSQCTDCDRDLVEENEAFH